MTAPTAVTLGPDVLRRYRQFSLYNSPYAAHDRGCAIDLYPEGPEAPSPVAGEVLDTRTVRAPPKPYAAEHDHLILVDAGERVARTLHVDPSVEPGETVAVGDTLGTLVRAGFFAPWVDNHVHLGFRPPEADPYRASGSLPIRVDAEVRALEWDGTGTVVEAGETYAILDSPAHPAPGEYFVGIGSGGGPGAGPGPILDGGCPHYEGAGALGRDDGDATGAVSLAGERVGTATGRDVAWDDLRVVADGREIVGVSLFLSRERFGAKLVCPDAAFAVGDEVTVCIDRA